MDQILDEGIGKVKQGSFKWNVNLCKITNVSKALARRKGSKWAMKQQIGSYW
jgi:hypothetical protein